MSPILENISSETFWCFFNKLERDEQAKRSFFSQRGGIMLFYFTGIKLMDVNTEYGQSFKLGDHARDITDW